VAVHETVAVPEPPVMALGVIAPQLIPEGTMSVRVTVPVKPFSALMVMVEVAETPTLAVAGEVAVIVKSVNVKVAFAA